MFASEGIGQYIVTGKAIFATIRQTEERKLKAIEQVTPGILPLVHDSLYKPFLFQTIIL